MSYFKLLLNYLSEVISLLKTVYSPKIENTIYIFRLLQNWNEIL